MAQRAPGGEGPQRAFFSGLRRRLREPAVVHRIRVHRTPFTAFHVGGPIPTFYVGGFRASLASARRCGPRPLRGPAPGCRRAAAKNRLGADRRPLAPGGGRRDSGRVLLRAPVGAEGGRRGQEELPAQRRGRGLARGVQPKGAGGLRSARWGGADPPRLREGSLVGGAWIGERRIR